MYVPFLWEMVWYQYQKCATSASEILGNVAHVEAIGENLVIYIYIF